MVLSVPNIYNFAHHYMISSIISFFFFGLMAYHPL